LPRLCPPRTSLLPYTTLFRSNGKWWDTGSYSATARVQRFQVLQDPDNPIVVPYGRTPQLTLSTLRQDIAGFDFGSSAEFVEFSQDRKSTRLNSSHEWISYAVF